MIKSIATTTAVLLSPFVAVDAAPIGLLRVDAGSAAFIPQGHSNAAPRQVLEEEDFNLYVLNQPRHPLSPMR